MGKRIVGYVISHSGKPGGPWEDRFSTAGTPTTDTKKRFVCAARGNLADTLTLAQRIHPAARILRLVRRERHTAEERAVVEAAIAWEHWANLPASECTPATFRNLRLAGDRLATNCAALRAKRGGK